MRYIGLNKDDNDDYDDNNHTSESEETSWPLDRYVSLMGKMTATGVAT